MTKVNILAVEVRANHSRVTRSPYSSLVILKMAVLREISTPLLLAAISTVEYQIALELVPQRITPYLDGSAGITDVLAFCGRDAKFSTVRRYSLIPISEIHIKLTSESSG